ncbi:class I SAM-dependent methyltransferase [Schinkia azotoformans]|uniref:class I SAM-dependent methyltransferase n=1 Tax=Schinkia azotoformans TaxID=1454 RepID=UPI002E2441DD|nr:class I SAM-dependent methyltransferase [Schinkia azotoformans]
MNLSNIEKNWNALGEADPLWAILTEEQKKGGKWNLKDFLLTGEVEVNKIMNKLNLINHSELKFEKALDFGCGVGRITQSLCKYFKECVGVDIAKSMIIKANEINRYPGKCSYILNKEDNLQLFPNDEFDLVFTTIVLQHMHPDFGKRYIKEFLRVLKPGGILVFQLPSEPIENDSFTSLNAFPLPLEAFKSEITCPISNINIKPNETFTLKVKIKNNSFIDWPSIKTNNGQYHINLGNHWYKSDNTILLYDDVRVNIKKGLQSMEETFVDITIIGPSNIGSYKLVIDLVQEGVAWFSDKGGKVLKLDINVQNENEVSNHEENTVFPIMEMYGIPRMEIEDLLRMEKGRLLLIEEDYSSSGWKSYKYFVTK